MVLQRKQRVDRGLLFGSFTNAGAISAKVTRQGTGRDAKAVRGARQSRQQSSVVSRLPSPGLNE
jgi:hypothetical protein